MSKDEILVVEDENVVALDIQNQLLDLGYAVPAVVRSGEEAIQEVERTRPDLALMDIKLEGEMDGVEAAERIRDRFGIPVVYLTAYADDETLQRARITEPFGYILKPFDERELHSTVEMALYKHRMERKLRESEEHYAQLHSEARQRALEQETLREAALAMTARLEQDKVIEHILAQLREVVPYDTASVQLLRDDYLELVGGRGFPNLEELIGLTFDLDPEVDPSWDVIRTREPVILEDAPAAYEGFQEPPHDPAGIRAWMGVPMLVGDRVIGVLTLDKREPGFYTQRHARLAEAFAAEAAVAMENARLFEAERKQRQRIEALEEAAAAVNSVLDLDEVLERILEQVERVVEGDAFNVMLIADSEVEMTRRRGYQNPRAKGRSFPLNRYPNLAKMAHTGEPIVVWDTAVDPDWVQEEDKEWIHSYVGAPIKVGGENVPMGFVNVDSARPEQFDSEDAECLEAFADHVATAIENARLYQELHDYADELEGRVEERTAQLRSRNAQLEAILDSTADGIVVTGDDGELVLANPVARTWLHRTLSPEDAELLRETVRDLAARSEGRPRKVLELTGLDLELRAASIAEPELERADAVVAIHDVSHLKALDRMKTQFVSNMSHELRTPASTIKLYAHLMRKQPDRWREHLEILAQEADHQAHLVERILEMSRMDAGRLGLQPSPTPVNDLTDMAVSKHEALAEEAEVTLTHRPAESSPVVLVDPQRMMQVLDNLLSNAVHYTPGGGGVTISTDVTEASGRTWGTVTVSDTGMGIPEEELPSIFDRFFRGEKPRSMQISGTGLGLSIVKEIVELHGGRVTVESEVGEGSAFTVWLPLAD